MFQHPFCIHRTHATIWHVGLYICSAIFMFLFPTYMYGIWGMWRNNMYKARVPYTRFNLRFNFQPSWYKSCAVGPGINLTIDSTRSSWFKVAGNRTCSILLQLYNQLFNCACATLCFPRNLSDQANTKFVNMAAKTSRLFRIYSKRIGFFIFSGKRTQSITVIWPSTGKLWKILPWNLFQVKMW